jgi:hypothetical protein
MSSLLSGLSGLLGLGDIASSVIGKIALVLNYIIGFIGGFLLAFVSWLTDIVLTLNINILDDKSSVAQVGWNIVRDVANLGFVLIIVVIAIGVMLRIEKYGSQKLLVRLIAAAILVNFSLAIAGAFLQFSHTLTTFFLSKVPSISLSSDPPFVSSGLGSALAGAFNSQRFLSPENFAGDISALNTFGTSLLTSIASVFFSAAFTFIAIIVVATFGIMLLVRYLHLIFLLVLAPIVWLFWVIPNLSGKFGEWWNSFIKWTFFAPAAAFFIYLSFRAVELIGTQKIFLTNQDFFTGAIAAVMSQGAQMVVIAGIMLGGLIVAQKMGIESANIGLNLANKAKAGALGWAGRKSLQAGSALFRRKGTEPDAKSNAEKIQGWAEKRTSILGRYAAGWVARGAATLSTAGGEDQVKYHGSQVKGMSEAETKAALLTSAGPRKIALIKKLADDGKLGDIDMTKIATDSNKKLFASFGQGKVFDDAGKAGLMSVEMADAIKKGPAGQKELADATDELVRKMTRKDMTNSAVKDLFSGKAKFGLDLASVKNLSEHFARAVGSENPNLVPSILPKLDSKSLNNFEKIYRPQLEQKLEAAEDIFTDPKRSPVEQKTAKDEMDKLNKTIGQLDKTLANYAIGLTSIDAGTGGTTTVAPTPPPAVSSATP